MADIRTTKLQVRVSPQEEEVIRAKMAMLGTKNTSAYLRKMAVDGYIVRLDFPELKKMTGLLGRCSNNLNQVARRANESGRIYQADLEDLKTQQQTIINLMNRVLEQLGDLQ